MTATPQIVHPKTGEKLFAPRPGVEIRSVTRKYNDDPEYQSTVGGWIINSWAVTDDGRKIVGAMPDTVFETIDWRWNKAWYTTINWDDIDWDSYSGGINTKAIKQLAKLLNADMARSNNNHLHALLALTSAIENR